MILFSTWLLGWAFPCFIAILAAYEDVRFLRLSNRHALVLLIAFPLVVAVVPPIHFIWGLVAALAVLIPGLVLFALHLIGGGDVKLASVMALYVGLKGLGDFILGTCLMGGVLALIALCVRCYMQPLPVEHEPHHWLDRLRQGQRDLPYGVALAVAFILVISLRMVYAADFDSIFVR